MEQKRTTISEQENRTSFRNDVLDDNAHKSSQQTQKLNEESQEYNSNLNVMRKVRPPSTGSKQVSLLFGEHDETDDFTVPKSKAILLSRLRGNAFQQGLKEKIKVVENKMNEVT